jgi:predicted ATPase/DNA-binding CsgD family transcriptional regulator
LTGPVDFEKIGPMVTTREGMNWLATERAHLPRVTTSLVGRERERMAIAELLNQPETRLVTLTGPGGVGKTRLAIQCGYDLGDQFPDGVVFVGLSALDDASNVPAAIASALGVSSSGVRPELEQLADALATRRALLVLDNLEHLIECGPALSWLLQSCPELAMLGTSRAPLNVSDELEFEILPLPLPDTTEQLTEAIVQAEAVALFDQRARAARPDFKLTSENARTVAEICRLLDGLPLAIELAAVRTKLLEPSAILSRLAISLDLLKHGPRDAPDRLQTMRSAVAWSYNLLGDADRSFFRRIAVFPGSFSLGAARAVALDDGREAEFEVLERIDSLVDKSLLRRIDADRVDPRFIMLHTIRDYGREQLAEVGEVEIVRDRQLAWCLAFAEDAESHYHFSDHWDWSIRPLAEIDNFRQALAWALQRSPGDVLPRLTASLCFSWITGARLREGDGWLSQALAHDDRSDPLITVKNYVGAGLLATFQGDFERARVMWTQCRPLAASLSEPRWLGIVDFGQGLGEQDEGRPEDALRSFESAVATFRRGNRAEVWEGVTLSNVGLCIARLGDIEKGREILLQALEINRKGDHSWNISHTLRYLGQLAKDAGDLDEAERCFEEALRFNVHGILGWHVANALECLAEISFLRRRPVKAARLSAVADRIRSEIGAPLEPALFAQQQAILGSVRESLGEDAFAAHWHEGSRLAVSDALEEKVEERPRSSSESERLLMLSGLTRRELTILQLFAAGNSMQEVSTVANISPRTVATHLSNIYAKFAVNDRGAAVARAYQLGLVARPGDSDADAH